MKLVYASRSDLGYTGGVRLCKARELPHASNALMLCRLPISPANFARTRGTTAGFVCKRIHAISVCVEREDEYWETPLGANSKLPKVGNKTSKSSQAVAIATSRRRERRILGVATRGYEWNYAE